jgi:hypothetical protein
MNLQNISCCAKTCPKVLETTTDTSTVQDSQTSCIEAKATDKLLQVARTHATPLSKSSSSISHLKCGKILDRKNC